MSPCHLCDKKNQENGISREQQGPSRTRTGSSARESGVGTASECLPLPEFSEPASVFFVPYHESVLSGCSLCPATLTHFQRSGYPPPTPASFLTNMVPP